MSLCDISPAIGGIHPLRGTGNVQRAGGDCSAAYRGKRTRAFTDHDYFLNCYAKEMSQKAIVAEAKAILAAQTAKEGILP